jgi:hypothetical protein
VSRRYWVGRATALHPNGVGSLEVFSTAADVTPSEASHGAFYRYIVGPFDTLYEARFAAQKGLAPCLLTKVS